MHTLNAPHYNAAEIESASDKITHLISNWIERQKDMPVSTLIPHQFNNMDTVSNLIQWPANKALNERAQKAIAKKIKGHHHLTNKEMGKDLCLHTQILQNLNEGAFSSADLKILTLKEPCETYCEACQRTIGCGHIYVIMHYNITKQWLSCADALFESIPQSSYSKCTACLDTVNIIIPIVVIPESTLNSFYTIMKTHIEDEKFADHCRKMVQYSFKIFTEEYERVFSSSELAIESYMAFVVSVAIDTFETGPYERALIPSRIKLTILESVFSARTTEEARHCFYWALLIADLLCCRLLTQESNINVKNCLIINMEQDTSQIMLAIHKRIAPASIHISDTEIIEQISQIQDTGLLQYIEQRNRVVLRNYFQYIIQQTKTGPTGRKREPPNNGRLKERGPIKAHSHMYELDDDYAHTTAASKGKKKVPVHERAHTDNIYTVVGMNVPGDFGPNVIRAISCYPVFPIMKRNPVKPIPKRPLCFLYASDGHLHTFNTGRLCDTCGIELMHENPSHVTDAILIKANHFYEFNKQFCAAGKFHRLDHTHGTTICLDCHRDPYMTLADVLQCPSYYNNVSLKRISVSDQTPSQGPTENSMGADMTRTNGSASREITKSMHSKLMDRINHSDLQCIELIYNRTFLRHQFVSRTNLVRHLLYIARSLTKIYTPPDEICNFNTPVVNGINILHARESDLEAAYWVLYQSFYNILMNEKSYKMCPKLEAALAQTLRHIQIQLFDDDNVANQDIAYNIISILLKLMRDDQAAGIIAGEKSPLASLSSFMPVASTEGEAPPDEDDIKIILDEEDILSDEELPEEESAIENKLIEDLEGVDT